MSFRAGRRTLAALAALAAGLTLSSTTSAASASGHQEVARPAGASVTGKAEFLLPYHQDDDVRSFAFDARADPYTRPLPGIPTGLPTDARGTVTVSHYSAENDITYTAEGRVDCLVTGVRTAT
ncbi:hypothetical protein G3M55_76475, partial [Streptomyces sp. SID8455]|nr:hypothetical protein [Streptomyces sp. SID8455]